MDNSLEVYHDILLMGQNPWVQPDVSENKYKELLNCLSKANHSVEPVYVLSFIKPLSTKRKYYSQLMESAAVVFLNTLYEKIDTALNTDEKKYWVHNALKRVIPEQLKEASRLIDVNEFYLEQLSAQGITDPNTKEKLDNIYVIQLLKYNLIMLYLEIQSTCKDYLHGEYISEEELHYKYFSEPMPDVLYINATSGNKPISQQNNVEAPAPQTFITKPWDFRIPYPAKTLSYSELIEDTNKFSNFEELLNQNGLIDKEYNFIDDHGNIQLMAAIFQTLIAKKYFKVHKFPGRKKILPREIRKFLDHRYNSRTDKQFRDWGRDPNGLHAMIKFKTWITSLP